MEWNADRSIAVEGIALGTVLLALDRAGKLKGVLLLALLALAVCMLTPVVLTIPWVSHAAPGSQLWARRLLMLFALGVLWAGLCVWVTAGVSTEPLAPSAVLTTLKLEKLLNLT